MGPNVGASRQESGRARFASASGPDRVRDGERCSGSAMDDEFLSCRNRCSLLQASQARYRYRREAGNLSRLSGLQGLHLSVRPDLDQRNGASAKLNESTYPLRFAGNNRLHRTALRATAEPERSADYRALACFVCRFAGWRAEADSWHGARGYQEAIGRQLELIFLWTK